MVKGEVVKINYLLLNSSNSGIIKTRKGIFSQIKDITLLFTRNDLKNLGNNSVVCFYDKDDKKYEVPIINNKCNIPAEIIKPPEIRLCVLDIQDTSLVNKYNCEPLPILEVGETFKSWYEINPDYSSRTAQIAGLEIKVDTIMQSVGELNTLKQVLRDLITEIEELKSKGELL